MFLFECVGYVAYNPVREPIDMRTYTKLKGNIMAHQQDRPRVPPMAWLVWGLAALYYFTQYILRVVPSVIQSELMITFEITATISGYLGGLFYYPYIIMQMPTGALVDRFGARYLLGFGALLCGLSAFLFAQADSLIVLFISRFLLGLCSAAGFVSALKLAKTWFPASLLGLIVGITQTFGMLGASSGGPISSITETYGYPSIFWGIGTFFVVLSALCFMYVRNAPTDLNPHHHSSKNLSMKTSVLKVFKSKYTWINAMYAGLLYAPIQVLGEYWGVVFFSNVYDLSNEQAAWAKSMLFIGWLIGSPFAGVLSDRVGRRPVMILSALSCTALLALLFLAPTMSSIALFIVCFLLGLSNTGLIAAYAASGELHDSQAAGLSMAVANMFSILFGAILIPICGTLLDAITTGNISPTGEPIYTLRECLLSFSILPVCALIALGCSFMMKETYTPKAK